MPQAKIPNGIPPPAEFGLLRAFLALAGVTQAEITAAIGRNVGGRNRAAIADKLRTWLQTLPKG